MPEHFLIRHYRKLVRDAWKIALLFAAYFLAGRFGLMFQPVSGFATLVWPPTGVALAALVLFGYRLWPGVLFGAFLANFTTGAPFLVAASIAAGNTLEALTGAFFLRKAGFRESLGRLRDALNLIELGAIASTTVSATIGTLSLWLGGIASPDALLQTWVAWWLGDALGNLVVAPLILIFGGVIKKGMKRMDLKMISPGRLAETGALLALTTFTSFFIFGRSGVQSYPFTYLFFIPLIWAALRFNQSTVAGITFIVSTIGIWGTEQGFGPFMAGSHSLSLIYLQTFMAVFASTGLVLGGGVVELANLKRAIEKLAGERGEALERSEEQYKNLIDVAPDIIWTLSPRGEIVSVNPAWERITGWPPDRWIGKHFLPLIHPDDAADAEMQFAYVAEGETISALLETRVLTKSGGYVTLESRSQPIERNGELRGVLTVSRDVSDSKRVQELEEEKTKYVTLLESIGDGITASDSSGRIAFVNAAAEKIMGWKRNDLIGKSVYSAIRIEDESGRVVPTKERPLALALKEGKATASNEYYYVRKDWSRVPVSINITPITLGGQIIGAIDAFRDITLEKQLDNAKNEFIAIASHQLRTPLTGIQWALERFTKREAMSGKGREYLADVHASARKLTELIDLLLNLSRIEAGHVGITVEPVDIVAFVKSYLSECEPFREKKNLRVVFDDHPRTLPAKTDKSALRNIVQSVVSNALEYTPAGGTITVSASKKGERYMIKVADTGIGIPRSEQPLMFRKFIRASNAKLLKIDGTGIGLYVAERATHLLGGNIWFESKEKKGSTFYMDLPVKSPSHAGERSFT